MSATAALGQTPRSSADLVVRSTAFPNNGAIPSDYTCDGVAIPPPLSWSNVPANTRSIAILVEDQDAPQGAFTHWLVTNISPRMTSTDAGLPREAFEAKNDKGTLGYGSPCPPSGTHHYVFRVYALDTTMPKATTKADFLYRASGHILAMGELVGTYTHTSTR